MSFTEASQLAPLPGGKDDWLKGTDHVRERGKGGVRKEKEREREGKMGKEGEKEKQDPRVSMMGKRR